MFSDPRCLSPEAHSFDVCMRMDVWKSPLGTSPAAGIILGDVLSTALTPDFSGSCVPTAFAEVDVLCYAERWRETKSDE